MNDSEPKKLFFDISSIVPLDEEVLKEYEQREEELKAANKLRIYKNSGVPSKFFDTSLESYRVQNSEEETNKRIVMEYATNPKNRVLILCGLHGNGKSHLACGIIREYGGVYVISSNLCIEYEAGTIYHSPRTREEILSHYSQKKMLVIDECGKYTLNENLEKFLLTYLISARYENNLPTVLVTNAKKKEFIEFLGISIYDRLTEVGTTLTFTHESKRKSLRQ